jgi:hypothetical protein
MAKVVMGRDLCTEKVNIYRAEASAILKEEQVMLATIKDEGPDSAFKRLGLSDSMMNLASCYIVANGINQAVLNQKNEDMLNDARKALYKGIIYLEAIVSNLIDAPYSDYEEKLSHIATVSPSQRYLLVRKMGLAINLVESAYGDNTKWKWTFVEMEGRYATVAKNIINMKEVVANTNLESENYEPTIRHLRLAKKLLGQAADRYREKYELSTGRIDDFKMGINYLSALRRLHIILGDSADAVTTKKKLDTWNNKLASDQEKQEKEKQQNKG